MPNSPSTPVRRGQLIVPFGTGSIITAPGGTSLVVAGLDTWFANPSVTSQIDENEFKVEEWRLQKLLSVNHFRLPPDYRESYRWAGNIPNSKITVPAFRFPKWHFCAFCKLLIEQPAYVRGNKGRIECNECKKKGKTRFLVQVPFIAICERGHLNEFPWREWVHRTANPSCTGTLRLVSTGSAMLAGQKIKCDECNQERYLTGITNASESNNKTTLSSSLQKDEEFLCPGEMPWFGPNVFQKCSSTIRGALKNASNVYFAEVRSSIYLPATNNPDIEEITAILVGDPLAALIRKLSALGERPSRIVETLRSLQPVVFKPFSEDKIIAAIELLQRKSDTLPVSSDEVDSNYRSFRIEEYGVLTKSRNDMLLSIKEGNLSHYSDEFAQYFSKIMLVDKLRETRVLSGFSRVFAENDQTIEEKKTLLWNNPNLSDSWLPASIVFGEGIFLEIDQELLQNWAQDRKVLARVDSLVRRYSISAERRKLRLRELGPRFILIHTLSHILINRLTFECGYSSAALRERLYISEDVKNPMAGVLIFTADGDAEGTMGGLVRMGKPGNIEKVFFEAIEQAKWCSADPVCMEMGSLSGQGPDSCNLAACHNCALVPETACEEFNRFLDRGLLIGDIDDQSIGFFNSI